MSDWTAWSGNEADPVGRDVVVEVEFRDGSRHTDRDWIWKHNGEEDDIVAYRLLLPQVESKS